MKHSVDVDLFTLEHRAGLLKERIYATIILLAVLISIDPAHNTPFEVLIIISGTTISLWAASLVASQMARRIILKKIGTKTEIHHRLREHSPLLAAGSVPFIMSLLAVAGLMELTVAIAISIGYSILLMILWSLLSAKAMDAQKWLTLFVAGMQFAIGLGIVLLKFALEHSSL
jgi:hypothetical protein